MKLLPLPLYVRTYHVMIMSTVLQALLIVGITMKIKCLACRFLALLCIGTTVITLYFRSVIGSSLMQIFVFYSHINIGVKYNKTLKALLLHLYALSEGLVTNIARGKAECYIYHSTLTSSCIFHTNWRQCFK